MTIIANHPLSTIFAAPDIRYEVKFQTMGQNWFNNDYPSGIAGHIELVNGAARCVVNETDPMTYSGWRSELVFTYDPNTPTGERWYTWKFMVPSDWNYDIGMAVMQIHLPHDPPAIAVSFVLLLENGQLVARVPTDFLTPTSSSYRMARHPFKFGHWYSMCFHVNWQPNSTGFREMFVDGAPMFRQYGIPTLYNFPNGPYLKLGVYDFSHTPGWGTKTVYIRDVNIWSGNDGYQTVMGAVPLAPPRMVQL